MNPAWVYILQCADGSFYVGSTTNLERRLNEHKCGKFRGYTSTRLPVLLVYSQEFGSLDDAFRAERRLKGWSRSKKLALINGDLELLHALAECKNDSHSKNRTM